MRRLAVAAAVAMVAASGLAGTACGPAGQSCFAAGGGEGVLTYAHLWHAPRSSATSTTDPCIL